MRHLFTLLISCLLTIQAIAQQSKQTIVTTDIDNFWFAFDEIKSTTDSLKQLDILQKQYVDKGTPGLKAFMEAKDYTTAAWLNCIRKYPKYWASIRPKTYKVKSLSTQFNPYLKKFKKLYPELKPASIYFCIGAMRSGGTTQGDKVLIGAELATGDLDVDISELPQNTKNWLKTYFGSNPFKDIVLLNMHEYVHTQEKSNGNTLLAQCIFEGTADFVAELITGKVPSMPYMTYGKTNHEMLKNKFKTEMFVNEFSGWLYNGTSSEFGVGDLGYYIGYSICKNYYDKAENKKAVIKELIELDYGNNEVVEDFLKKTNYFAEGFNKAAIVKAYEKQKPVVTHIGPFKNGDNNVEANITEMTIFFSKPMDKNRMSISFGAGGEQTFPLKKSLGFADDNKSLKFRIELKPNQTYEMLITGRGFKSTDGYPLVEYPVNFKTK
ncbi:DUF2268 domain-containing putative Zn-dependent protease [Pedobacter aquatilis]|uniref:gliding motility protein GldB-related protein n=1 Tax=Pedobacter aquatilis TaxID=351343 RepID=UPI0025B43099|nr:DUF2268 domain-containing putative Zn-dependent protease [Pedobacter aquatilis]MDN3587785.1 DUF2268 domain-containing putative Zn-dependent protease [Pedobacter aquatilis]